MVAYSVNRHMICKHGQFLSTDFLCHNCCQTSCGVWEFPSLPTGPIYIPQLHALPPLAELLRLHAIRPFRNERVQSICSDLCAFKGRNLFKHHHGSEGKRFLKATQPHLRFFLFSGVFFCYAAHMLIGPTRLAVMAQLMRLQLIYGNAVNVYVRPGACTCTTRRAVNRTPNTRLHSLLPNMGLTHSKWVKAWSVSAFFFPGSHHNL